MRHAINTLSGNVNQVTTIKIGSIMPTKLLILLLLTFSLNAHAYSEAEDRIVKEVISDAKAKHYPENEIKWAVRSNVFTVPNIVLCQYLPRLSECR